MPWSGCIGFWTPVMGSRELTSSNCPLNREFHSVLLTPVNSKTTKKTLSSITSTLHPIKLYHCQEGKKKHLLLKHLNLVPLTISTRLTVDTWGAWQINESKKTWPQVELSVSHYIYDCTTGRSSFRLTHEQYYIMEPPIN